MQMLQGCKNPTLRRPHLNPRHSDTSPAKDVLVPHTLSHISGQLLSCPFPAWVTLRGPGPSLGVSELPHPHKFCKDETVLMCHP